MSPHHSTILSLTLSAAIAAIITFGAAGLTTAATITGVVVAGVGVAGLLVCLLVIAAGQQPKVGGRASGRLPDLRRSPAGR
jgi:hypothetical protein